MSNKTHPGIGHAHPHAEAAKNMAGQIDQTNVHADLGKAPLPKRAFTTAPEIHSGTNAKSRKDGTHFAGLSGQDLSRYDADGPDPLSPGALHKPLTPVMASPGMVRQQNSDRLQPSLADEAARILSQAANASLSDDRRALGIGSLPPTVSEEE